MALPAIDWVALWYFDHGLFFWVYILMSLSLRIVMVRRFGPRSAKVAWLASSTVSALLVFYMPFASIPAFLLAALVGGREAVSSFFMVLPIVGSSGLVATLLDATLFRVLLRETVNRDKLLLLLTTNMVTVALAVGSVLAWVVTHPPNVIAALDGWG